MECLFKNIFCLNFCEINVLRANVVEMLSQIFKRSEKTLHEFYNQIKGMETIENFFKEMFLY